MVVKVTNVTKTIKLAQWKILKYRKKKNYPLIICF